MMMEQLSGINQNRVTREFQEQYHAAQTIEMKQYVDETIAPVVSRQDSADSRLAALEQEVRPLREGAVHHPNVQAVVRRQQRLLDKLDPASRSLSVIGFTDMDPKSRVQLLESLMADTVHEVEYVQIDHVMKGPTKTGNSFQIPTLSSTTTMNVNAP